MAATVKKDPFKESQEQAALFEKLIKERSSGGSLFKLKLPEVRWRWPGVPMMWPWACMQGNKMVLPLASCAHTGSGAVSL